MNNQLRVLIVEDSEDDALLMVAHLKRGGYEPEYERVETGEAMRKALAEKVWDVVLCDYRLPAFDGLKALEVFRESGADIPFIIVSGAIGEETVVMAMKTGAHDCIMKGNLSRLVPVVERERGKARKSFPKSTKTPRSS
jgi:DNA-binding NtrC family response regulator